MTRARSPRPIASCSLVALIVVTVNASPATQERTPPAARRARDELRARSAADHGRMMEQLGIERLRPGPNADENAPNAANYDEQLANPFSSLPDPLTFNDGSKVTSAEQWAERRKEIIEEFEREVYGRIPPNVPPVTWRVDDTDTAWIGGHRVIGTRLAGRVDNGAFPDISVEIHAVLVRPAEVETPVPVMIMFRRATLAQALGKEPFTFPGGFVPPRPPPGSDPPATAQLIAAGWGYVLLDPASIQADNGAGLTSGIIGLVNKGERRQPDDWGALRAWSWGAARVLDYLETNEAVDASRVGIEGVSRYGKAALVTMAFEPRFAAALIGSSGAGGAKLFRRNFGETVENLTGAGEYHWMAGNFLRYGAAEASFGSKNANDLPVDAHELIALCAPRLIFISYGVPEEGDAKWVDQRGSFMAAVAAGPVFRLLGAQGLGVTGDYRTAEMPAVNTGLLDGQLAWRQHDGGHTDGPNWKHFIAWVDAHIDPASSSTQPAVSADGPDEMPPADVPTARTDAMSRLAHEELLDKARRGRIDLYFLGDSIVRRWGATDYPELLANWNDNFFGWNAANFGWGADRIENILWRIEHGELDGVNPKVIVLLAGTNNVGSEPGGDAAIRNIMQGLDALVRACRRKAPSATIIVTAILPRNDNMAVMAEIRRINAHIAQMADGKTVRVLNVNDKLADAEGQLFEGMMSPRDKLHPTVKAYQVWAGALKPILTELLGPPAATDDAPPPTGVPRVPEK